MTGLAENGMQEKNLDVLRTRLARVRRELSETTAAYRTALAHRDSVRTIPLLRSRSQLMRQLLETQCELFLAFRSGETASPEASSSDLMQDLR